MVPNLLKKEKLKLFFIFLLFPLLFAESYNVEMMVVDSNGNKYFNKTYICDGSETFYECMVKVPFPEIAKVYYDNSDKTLYTIMKVWKDENNNIELLKFNTLSGDVKGITNSLKNLYFNFYTLFAPNVEFREVRAGYVNAFSYIQPGEQELFDSKTKNLFKKFLNNINYSNFLKFEGNELKYKGLYIYNYMVTENLETIGVDDPPLFYIYLYKNKNNYAAKYITSVAYETWNGGDELRPDSSSLMSTSPIWYGNAQNNNGCNKLNDNEGSVTGIRCFCRNPTHHNNYESCTGVNVQVRDYWDLNNELSTLGTKALDYLNTYMLAVIFETTGIPVFPDKVGGDTDATYETWKNSLQIQDTETEKKFTYPFKALGLDPNGYVIDLLKEPVTCKYFYNLEYVTTTGTCENEWGDTYTCQVPVTNSSNPCLETEPSYDEEGSEETCVKPNYIYNVTVFYYCPSVIVNETAQYLWTFRMVTKNYIIDEAGKEEFLGQLSTKCVNDFVKPLVEENLDNFQNSDKVNVDASNNKIIIKKEEGNTLIELYNGKIYNEICSYEEANPNVGAYLSSWQEYFIPIAFTIDKFKDKEITSLSLRDFIVNKTKENLKGIKSKFCVGNKCAYFFLGEDSDPELIRSYPKIFYLKNYAGVVQKSSIE